LSTTFRRRSSMVIWIVFTAVDFNVDRHPRYTPHPVVGIRADSCGNFAGISPSPFSIRKSRCFRLRL
jgi:hypothetical protein